MDNVTLLAIDLAKNIFQLHGMNQVGKSVLRKKISRAKLLSFVANLPTCDICMEACGSANYWGRKFEEQGHRVKLIHPKYVKPYVKRNKNDVNDAAGIASAAKDPNMRFCAVKTERQQDVQSVHRIRSLLLSQRTALGNQVRGLLAEYGIAIPKSKSQLRKHLTNILGDNPNDLSALMLDCLQSLYDNFQRLDEQITLCDQRIKALFNKDAACKRLASIPGGAFPKSRSFT